MNLEAVARLEKLVDRLLERNRQLEQERDHFRSEIDRILAKIDRLERETS